MRVSFVALALVGCGAVRLGEDVRLGNELPTATRSGADAQAVRILSDGGGPTTTATAALGAVPVAVVTVTWPGGCSECVDLLVEGVGGEPPYRFEWEDGVETESRHLCGDEANQQISVVVEDARNVRSVAHTTKLELGAAPCPVEVVSEADEICLQNLSFEGKPGFNTGFPTVFDGAPWSVCTNPSVSNTPDIADPAVGPPITDLPDPTDGLTWLGLMEDEQTSQPLCSPMLPGTSLSFTIDLHRINVGANLVPDTEAAFLEVWGGGAADCSAQEKLWVSPKLENAWKTHCVTLRPTKLTDNLVLRSRSDQSQASTTYLIADNIVPVPSCP
jgi:hypothetical protein